MEVERTTGTCMIVDLPIERNIASCRALAFKPYVGPYNGEQRRPNGARTQ